MGLEDTRPKKDQKIKKVRLSEPNWSDFPKNSDIGPKGPTIGVGGTSVRWSLYVFTVETGLDVDWRTMTTYRVVPSEARSSSRVLDWTTGRGCGNLKLR